MEQFVEYIVKNLVDDSESVDVRALKGQGDILIEIRVNPDDIGKLVGRKGRTINAVRILVGTIAAKMELRSRVEIIEDKDRRRSKSDEEQGEVEESSEESVNEVVEG